MSGYQGHNDYDHGYGQQHQGNTDSYYQDEQHQYYDQNGGYDHSSQHDPNGQHDQSGQHDHSGQHNDGYYDEA